MVTKQPFKRGLLAGVTYNWVAQKTGLVGEIRPHTLGLEDSDHLLAFGGAGMQGNESSTYFWPQFTWHVPDIRGSVCCCMLSPRYLVDGPVGRIG